MHKLLAILSLSFIICSCAGEEDADPGSADTFVKLFGGANLDDPQVVVTTPDGGYLVLATTEIDSVERTLFKIKLIKADEFGNQAWQRIYPGSNEVSYKGRSLVPYNDGYLIIGDRINPGDEELGSEEETSLLVLGVDQMGELTGNISNITLPSASLQGYGIVPTRSGDLAVVGKISSDTTDNNIFTSRLDGTALQVIDDCTAQYEANDVDLVKSFFERPDGSLAFAGSIANGSNGQVFVLPGCQASVLAGPSLVPGATATYTVNQLAETTTGLAVVGTTNINNNQDVFFARLTSLGEQVSLTVFDDLGPADDQGLAITTTSDGGFIIGGLTEINTSNEADLMIRKLNFSGEVQWTRVYGDLNEEEVRFIQETPDGGFVVLGKIEFGGIDNIVLLKTDAQGNIN